MNRIGIAAVIGLVLAGGLLAEGCRKRRKPDPQPEPIAVDNGGTNDGSGAAVPAEPLDDLSYEEAKAALADSLLAALKPAISAVPEISSTRFRYKYQRAFSRIESQIIINWRQVGGAEIVKNVYVAVMSKGKRRLDRIRFNTLADARRFAALVRLWISPEFQSRAKAAEEAAKPPPPTSTPPPAKGAPCTICGEPRGNVSPCPHCGMD